MLGALAGCGYAPIDDVSSRSFGAEQYGCTMTPESPSFSTVEIGPDITGSPFTPLHDGDSVQEQMGGQGLSMIVLRFRVKRLAQNACVSHRTTITASDGHVISRNREPLWFSARADGTGDTEGVFFPGTYDSVFKVDSAIGSASTSLSLSVGAP